MGIGVIFVIVCVIVLTMSLPDALSITRSDINDLKDQITTAENNIDSITDSISSQRNTVLDKESNLETEKNHLRDVKNKSSQSWEALLSIEAAQISVVAAENAITSANNVLFALLSDRATYTSMIKSLTKQLSNDRVTIDNENKADLSNLHKLIGVKLSDTCEVMIINNLPTTCPSYKQLAELDSSNLEISGHFVETPWFHRGVPPYEESWNWYDIDDQLRIIVDPPNGMGERIKTITITNNFGVYFTSEDMQIINHTRTWYESRYVDNCKTALIDSLDWQNILADTIHYIRTDCTVTGLDEKRSEILPQTYYDHIDSPNWLILQQVEQTKLDCKGLCFEY